MQEFPSKLNVLNINKFNKLKFAMYHRNSIKELLDWGTIQLTNNKVESPRLNAELILCHILQLKKIGLYSKFDRILTGKEAQNFYELTERRCSGEPLQYILGKVNFLGYDFKIKPGVLIPRPETELLCKIAIDSIENDIAKILDIGTGSGCIALTIAKERPSVTVRAIDNSDSALEIAKSNAAFHGLSNVNFENCDILNNLPAESGFDIIISNPPYINLNDYTLLDKVVKDWEPRSALTDEFDGLTFYKRYADIFPELLKPTGTFFLEIGFGMAHDIEKIFSSKGFICVFFKDFSSIPRIVQGSLKQL
ncbi:MAG: Methyltransferase [Ignavibacteria bacterium]|nr:Methyltransferase [Ignavibacteria bacterium]